MVTINGDLIMDKISILHISDLHKTKGVPYETLLDSLCDDRQRWIQESIQVPNFIVISGDLIEGAYADDEIRDQYAEVSIFLEKLVSEFLDGDKTRLIMVPGNHDVNRACSSNSMTEISAPSADELKFLKKNFWKPECLVRFDWKTMNFFKVNDIAKYNERFSLFKDFYDKFYGGLRRFPSNSTKEAFVCSFEKEHIVFAGFNSCNFLDDKNVSGNIDEESLSSISSKLRMYDSDGYLIVGVWHHHYYGDPYITNYMSRDVFFPMSEKGIRMGLFGHQHFSEVADEYISPYYVNEEQRKEKMMLLVSSGTLFGGEKQLQPGFRRQYNIIEIERHNLDSQIDIAINIREDKSKKANSKIPFWQCCPIVSTTDNKIHKRVLVKGINKNQFLLQLMKKTTESGEYEQACNSLLNLGLDDKHVRDLFDEFLQKTSARFQIEILQNIDISLPETIILLYAVLNEKDNETAKKIKANKIIMNFVSSDSLLKDIWNNINQL